MADKDLSDSKTPHAEGAASASGQDIHNSTNTTSTNGDGGNSTAATESETENADPVETLQTLVTQHVELFERLLYVERDISNKDNIKRYQGALSEGLLRRHPADMRENMLVDWHRNAIHRALDETGTKGQIQTKEYSDGTHVKGEASAIQQMVEALSRNVFQEFLQNYNSVLSNLDQVPFVDKLPPNLRERIRILEAQRQTNSARLKELSSEAAELASQLRNRGDSVMRELLQVADK